MTLGCSTRAALLAALLVLAPGAPLRAEEQPGAAAYETVVVDAPVDHERPADDPAGFTTVLRIQAPPAGSGMDELLQRVPGLRVRDSGAGGRKSLSLRGSDSLQTVVLLDGIRLSSAGGLGVDLSLLDPAHLARIEVRRGGSSARYGSDALGGVLSLQTPRLRARERTTASLGYGSFETVAARAAHSGAVSRRARYLVSGSFRQSRGDYPYVHHLNHTAHLRENNDSRQGELLLKADLLPSSRWQLGLLDDLALGQRGAPGVLDSPCLTARQQDLRNLAALRATRFDLPLSGSRLDLTLHHRFGSFRFSDPCTFNRPSQTNAHTVGGRASLTVPLGRAGQLDAGLELREELLQDRLDLEQRTLAQATVDRFSADLYAASSWRLLARHLVLVPAVRLASASGQGATVVPKLGLVLHPLRWSHNRWLGALSLAGNVGRSFRYPSFHELYIDMDSLRGNPDLEPEDAVEADVGLRWSHPRLSLEAAYFRRQLSNMILYAPVSPYLVQAQNYSAVLSQGAEAALNLRPGWGLGLQAAYSFTRSRWGEPALELPGHPEHRLSARLGWRYPFKGQRTRWGLRLWGATTYESGMPLDQHNNIRLGQRVLLSAGGALSWRWLTVTAEGRNLLDRRDLLDSLGFPLPPARFLVALSAEI